MISHHSPRFLDITLPRWYLEGDYRCSPSGARWHVCVQAALLEMTKQLDSRPSDAMLARLSLSSLVHLFLDVAMVGQTSNNPRLDGKLGLQSCCPLARLRPDAGANVVSVTNACPARLINPLHHDYCAGPRVARFSQL